MPGVGLIVNLVITQLQRTRHQHAEQGACDNQQPDFFIEIQNRMLPQFNGLMFPIVFREFFFKELQRDKLVNDH